MIKLKTAAKEEGERKESPWSRPTRTKIRGISGKLMKSPRTTEIWRFGGIMGSWWNLCIPPNFSFWTFLFHLIKYMKFLRLLFSKMVKIKEISMNIEKWLSNCLLHDDDGLVWAFVTPQCFLWIKLMRMPTPFLKENSKYFLPRKVVEDLPKKKKN